MRFSYTARLSAALGRDALRLGFFAHLAQGTPLRSLSYPSGHNNLPALRARLLEDLERQPTI